MPTVLFICLHGSAKSLIAAGHFNRIASARGLDLTAEAAGIDPDPAVLEAVVASLMGDGIDARGYVPRLATADRVREEAHVVSLGCDLRPLGVTPVEQWDDLPAVSDGYVVARDEIVSRVTSLIDSGLGARAAE